MTARPRPVAVVAGATRGAGRGIATALGEAGYVVYCTGRSTRAAPRARAPGAGAFDLDSRPETIEDTAELVSARGGRGVAVRVDHTVEADVRALFDRVRADDGRLDLLVNDVWGGDALIEASSPFGRPFWEIDAQAARTLFERCVFSHMLTARFGVPLMVEARRGLVVEVTDGELLNHRGSFLYDLVKTAVIRLAFAMAEELRPHKVAAVAVTPGFLRSEAMLEHFGVGEANWREAGRKDPNFLVSESPLYVGRGVAALAADRRILAKSGRAFSSWRLARAYRFTDADGSRPDWGKHVTGKADRGTRAVFRSQFASHDRFVRSFAGARARP
jgi:NAD(P)-dependent dehydrogenase (short-subunit alcohol dehydrogenase family)